jgi:hypothetical protein
MPNRRLLSRTAGLGNAIDVGEIDREYIPIPDRAAVEHRGADQALVLADFRTVVDPALILDQ